MTVVTHYETIGDCLPTCAGAQNSAFQIGLTHAIVLFNNNNTHYTCIMMDIEPSISALSEGHHQVLRLPYPTALIGQSFILKVTS